VLGLIISHTFINTNHIIINHTNNIFIIIDKTRAFFCESVSNPALEICDLEVISASAHKVSVFWFDV